jgi:threonine dehydrogenase-like Zn-dependent dehydrogenase
MEKYMQSVKFDGKSSVRIVDVPEPEPGPDEVLIATTVSAICGSEMHSYRDEGQANGNGGHEAAGIVERVGKDVTNVKVGQRVGASAISGCGHCSYCARGQYTWCSNNTFYGSMHAEKFVVTARACHPLPANLPWEVSVLISGDGLGVPYHSSTRMPQDGVDSVAIFGLGPIGLGNVLMQTYLGRRVVAIDLSDYRLDYAQKLGARWTVRAGTPDTVAQVRELTAGMGVDIAIEAAGRPETAKQCFAAVRKGGTVVFNGEQGAFPLSPSDDFIRRDITALGSWFYHFREYGDMLRLYRTGLPVQDLVSHTYPFAKAPEAFAEFAAGKTAKVLLRWQE